MAWLNGSIYSAALGMETHINVLLPHDRPAKEQQTPCRVLYLLHGMGENSSSWGRFTRVEHFARHYGFAVVMPEVQRSFYADMQKGLRYFTFVSTELPETCNRLFNISTNREDTFIAGSSMGGYGAVRCAFTFPERFAAVAAFAGALDLAFLAQQQVPNSPNPGEAQAIFGDNVQLQPHDDIFALAANVAQKPEAERPRLMMTCGQEDFLLMMNMQTRGKLAALGITPHWQSWPGAHDWKFFDESLEKAFGFFVHPDAAQ